MEDRNKPNYSLVRFDTNNGLCFSKLYPHVVEQCKKQSKDDGRKVYNIDFSDPEHSSRYNLFLHFDDWFFEHISLSDFLYNVFVESTVKETGMITSDPLWIYVEKNILKLAVEYVVESPELCNEDRTFATLLKIMRSIYENEYSIICFDMHSSFYKSCIYYNEKFFKGVLANLISCFEVFSTPVAKCFEESKDTNNIDMNTVISGQSHLYYGYSELTERKIVPSSISMLFTKLFINLYKWGDYEERSDENVTR